VTTRIASVSPERRPAKKITWGGMDVASASAVDAAVATLPTDDDVVWNVLYQPPKTSR